MRRTIYIIVLIIIIFIGYHFRAEIKRNALIVAQEVGIIKPCSRPITYSIGTFDSRFGISKDSFLKDLSVSAGLWETAANRNLFQYAVDGDLKINLVYDYRQSSTQKMSTISNNIESARDRYDRIKSERTALNNKITAEKAELDMRVTELKSKSHISRQQFDVEVASIRELQTNLNSDIDTFNTLTNDLNKLAKELNIQVDTYNDIGASTGESFEEGQYVSDRYGQRIDIYQFGDTTKLERVLAHELGHALGIDHVKNNQSIMYYLNSGTSRKLTAEDTAALIQVCKL